MEGEERKVKEKTLEAIYNINKHARKYAERGTEYYNKNKGATAKKNSYRKKAFYKLKSLALRKLVDDADFIEKHRIDDRDYYCLFFDEWSFHTPVNQLNISNDEVKKKKTLLDFEKDKKKEKSDMTLKDALIHLKNELSLNANDYLPEKKIQYGNSRYFVGWKYL